MAKKRKKKSAAKVRYGSHYYRDQGLKGVVVRANPQAKMKLKLLAAKLQCPVNEAVQEILKHFFDNHKKYGTPDPGSNGSDVQFTVFIKPESHKDLRIQGILHEKSMKDLAGHVISRYLEKYCKIKLEIEK